MNMEMPKVYGLAESVSAYIALCEKGKTMKNAISEDLCDRKEELCAAIIRHEAKDLHDLAEKARLVTYLENDEHAQRNRNLIVGSVMKDICFLAATSQPSEEYATPEAVANSAIYYGWFR